MQTGYDPFNPQYLYAPMAREMDQISAQQMQQAREESGMRGSRWSSPMLTAQAGIATKTAQDKQKLLSQLMYQGAQDTYSRGQNSANMLMGLGGMQTGRDQALAQLMAQMGGQQQQTAQQMMDRQYQEWLRTNQDPLERLKMIMGGGASGYNTDFMRDQSWWDKYGGYVTAAAQIAGSF
jgi:hypothetical protein